MGYNIAGIAIKDNFGNDISKLEAELQWGIEIIEEVSFETASANWTPEGEFRLHFTDSSTIIFFPHEWIFNIFHIPEHDSMSFAYSATAMAFELNVYRNGKAIREISENHEVGRVLDKGDKLTNEEENEGADSLTFKFLEQHLNKSFYDIGLDEKSYRCKRKQYNRKVVNKIEAKIEEKVIPKTKSEGKQRVNEVEAKINSKKWWQIWK